MHLDLSLAVEEGMQSSVTRDKSIEEIDNVLFEVDQAVKKATNNKVEFGWRKKGFNTLGLLTGLTSLPITDVKIESQEPESRVLYVSATDDKTQRFDITILVISPDGFPCEMNVKGNKLISHDAESLLEQFKPLLSSAFVGDKIRKLMKKGA
ncbi:hypothetical protein [Acinetobacter pittii]|uniref:hypothetical protein n=1 Tax=Acinetobacter pittii TaxID=48296 RepID=UPI0005C48A00|nr:hypothetical protein [Acinetobacter pittii]